jgi:hypothetical protein
MKTLQPFRFQRARTDFRGFEQLAELYDHALSVRGATIDIDCATADWIDANLAAALGALAYTLGSAADKTIRLSNLQPRVKDILACNGVLGRSLVRRRSTVVPLRHFQPGDARKFAGYTQDHLSDKGMPVMSPQVEKRVFEGIDELFQNAEIHSKTKHGIFACGQLYPRTSRLDFSLVDLGIGFQRVVADALRRDLGPAAAIEWAMKGRNTTRSGDVPGGLGLKILREFIQLNGGRLSIVSHRGYWTLNRNGVNQRQFEKPFPGTIVTIEVNTADRSEYRMAHEINPASVF